MKPEPIAPVKYGYHDSAWWKGRRAVLLCDVEGRGHPSVRIGSTVTIQGKDPAMLNGFMVGYRDSDHFPVDCEVLSLL